MGMLQVFRGQRPLLQFLRGQRLLLHIASIVVLALAGCGGGGEELGGNNPPPAVTIGVVPAFPALHFDKPLFFTTAPGDDQRAFVVTQRGVIYVFDNDPTVATAKVFLDIDSRVTDEGGEQGLLGLAFDPDYATNGFFYVNYNPIFDNSGANPRRTVICRFKVTADPEVANPASETLLLSYEQPFGNHKGGWLGFGPDGKLYIAAGDGGSGGDPGNRAQDLGTLLGKMLRIEKNGGVPADNPFVNASAARGEIWAYGFRNPYRASFDRLTGALWAGDVGQNQWEEVDTVVKGGNYGWRKFEGTHVFNADDPTPTGAIAPVIEYGHDEGRCTVIGGYVYRGAALGAGFQGHYFFADFCTGELWDRAPADAGTQAGEAFATVPGNPSSFGEDAAGELYITSYDGNIYKVQRTDN